MTIIGMAVFGIEENGEMVPFYPDPWLLVVSFAIVMLLELRAFKYKNSRISTNRMPLLPPLAFGTIGFAFQMFNSFMPNIAAENHISGAMTLFVQILEAAFALLFVAFQLCHRDITNLHIVSLIFGSLLFLIALTPIHEFENGIFGMLAMGVISLVLLIWWRHRILSR